MAVDFADKFHDQTGEKWALLNAKLRFSRKVIFLASVLACFSWEARRISIDPKLTEQTTEMAQFHLLNYLSRPPLKILADELLTGRVDETTCVKIMSSYDEFLSILDDDTLRKEHGIDEPRRCFRFALEVNLDQRRIERIEPHLNALAG